MRKYFRIASTVVILPILSIVVLFAILFARKTDSKKIPTNVKGNHYCENHGILNTQTLIGCFKIMDKNFPVYWKSYTCSKCSWFITFYRVNSPFTRYGN